MIVILFKLIILTSIWVLGLTIITQPEMGLYKWRDKLTDNNLSATKTIYDPLLVCHWCMPSIHSLVGFVAAWGLGIINLSWSLLILYPFCVAGSSLFVGLTWMLFKLMEIMFKYFTNAQKVQYLNIERLKTLKRKSEHNGN